MLQAGFARIDATAPLGTYLAGYYEERYADGIVTPLELNAIALSDGENKAVFVISDLQGLRKQWADEIRKAISEKTGVKLDFVSVSALHQHSSYALRPGKANNVIKDNAFLDVLYRKFCDVAVMALDDLADAVMSVGEKEAEEQIAFIRRYKLKDGSYKTNPFSVIDEIVCPAEEPDNKVRLIKFKRENKNDIALINFQTHADVCSTGLKMCADWPGFTREYVENNLPDTQALLICGFEGDSNHINFMGEIKLGLEHSRHMGEVIGKAVKEMWNDTKEKEVTSLSSKIEIVYNKTNSNNIEYYDECVKLYREKKGQTDAKTESGIEYSEAGRIITTVESAPLFQKIPVTVISLGEVVIAGIGGEAFVNYGKNLRQRLPEKFIFTSCSMNGHEGYLPTASAFEHSTYEIVTSPFSPSIEKQSLDMLEKMIKE